VAKKVTSKPILAAGGIVVRDGARGLFAVVQRSKDSAWVLPRGKLKRDENPVSGARREVVEETGHRVRVHEFLGAITYRAGGRPKVVQFWRMEAEPEPSHSLMADITAVEWLPLKAAVRRLSYPLEKLFLRNIGPQALPHRQPAVRIEPLAAAEPPKTKAGQIAAKKAGKKAGKKSGKAADQTSDDVAKKQASASTQRRKGGSPTVKSKSRPHKPDKAVRRKNGAGPSKATHAGASTAALAKHHGDKHVVAQAAAPERTISTTTDKLKTDAANKSILRRMLGRLGR
jgi:8-oxo-dGTP diphosphatase